MEHVFLVAPYSKKHSLRYRQERLNEMMELIRSAGGKCVGYAEFNIEKPTSVSYLGKGGVEKIAEEIVKKKANVCIFGVDLQPTQSRNIENQIDVRVVDRTGLILDIFAKRATSREGKLQVELAQMSYLLPRLVGRGVVMSRLGGGIGTRGPGEQKLEVDRRQIRNRISKLKKDLKKLKTHRALLRKNRIRNNLSLISLLGYTNAGKSTLMNQLTGSDVYVQDKLFATLDSCARNMKGVEGRDVVITDTVGFLMDLPHGLVESFQATLEEIQDSKLIFHVLDVSNPDFQNQYEVTRAVLKEIKCDQIQQWLILNKVDLLSSKEREGFRVLFPEAFQVSSLKNIGVKELKEKVVSYFLKN